MSRAVLPGLPSHDRWLLSYADFVTLLLAVFIVLFAALRHSHGSVRTVSTAIHSGFEVLGVGSAPPSTPHDVSLSQAHKSGAMSGNAGELAHQLQDVFGDAIRKHEIVVQPTADGLTVRLQELGFFESGNAALLPDAAQKLQRTARILERYTMEVRVEGHSDDHPIRTAAFHSNWELSTARAMNVLTVLVDQAGFPPDRIAVTGYGPYRPVADNATEEGRRQNRRVDLVILLPHQQQDKAR
ncbi:MAG: OmpA/MotB family protein [Janthinobacterium lividum]